jgi:hypothetical protein
VRLIGGAGILTNAIAIRNVKEPSSDFSLEGDLAIGMLPDMLVALECSDFISHKSITCMWDLVRLPPIRRLIRVYDPPGRTQIPKVRCKVRLRMKGRELSGWGIREG